MLGKEPIEGLNHALNREVSTFLRYLLQSAAIKGAQWEQVRAMYAEEVEDEVGQARVLADYIVALGGTPKPAPDLTPPPTDVRQLLERDIEQEQIDVRHYIKLAELAAGEGIIVLKMKLEEQAADEQDHAMKMRRLLG